MKTIEVGIDLGTTNSSIAVSSENAVSLIKNNLGEEVTPSVIYIDQSGKIIIGKEATKLGMSGIGHGKNWKKEIKRLMGTNTKLDFPNAGKAFTPEEISSEILKQLRRDAVEKFPTTNLKAAVITVPAHFSTVQSEATKRAGLLSGFETVVLLQEPIAAAICYGMSSTMNENWLVYDLGGGTFDVALVAARDGHLTVLSHDGDNFLGGKDIDAAIVDKFIIPILKKKIPEIDLQNDPQLQQSLRNTAEISKIALGNAENTIMKINLEFGELAIDETIELRRSQLIEACESTFDKTIALCRKTISDAKVDLKSIKKIILVGGPTQMNILRQKLSEAMDIFVDSSMEPLTVVAKGAALYGKQVTTSSSKEIRPQTNSFELQLNYVAVSSDAVQTITGRVSIGATDPEPPFSISFQSSDKKFTSGDILLRNGKFACQVPTTLNENKFWIYLKSNTGNILSCNKDEFTISKGVSLTGTPLPHSVGVSILSLSTSKGFASVEETMDFFFMKNSILPLSSTKRFFTVRDLKIGSKDNALPVRVYEGESLIPNRNTLICDVLISGTTLTADLKKGSPIEITISINESREVTVKGYLAEIDVHLDARGSVFAEDKSLDQLKADLNSEVQRSTVVSASPNAKDEIRELITDIHGTLSKSVSDIDQRQKAAKQIRDLMVAVDNAESEASFDKNTSQYYKLCKEFEQYLIAALPKENREEYQKIFQELKRAGEISISKRDAISLKQIVDKINQYHYSCLFNDPTFLVGIFKEIKELPQDTNEAKTKLIAQCEESLKQSDFKLFKEGVHALLQIHYDKSPIMEKVLKSGITR